MTASRRYVVAVVLLAVATLALASRMTPVTRSGIWLALGVTLAVQAPLGWWLVRAVGRGQAMGAWAVGMAARFGLLALLGLGVLPLLGWPLEPTLIGLATLLLALLLVEGAVLWVEHFGSEGR